MHGAEAGQEADGQRDPSTHFRLEGFPKIWHAVEHMELPLHRKAARKIHVAKSREAKGKLLGPLQSRFTSCVNYPGIETNNQKICELLPTREAHGRM